MPQGTNEVHIIEGDPGLAELLVELLEDRFLVKTFPVLAEFKKSFHSQEGRKRPDLILCDSKIRDGGGLEVLRFVRQTDSTIPVVLMVSHPDRAWVHEAFYEGVTDLLEKPFESYTFIDQFTGRIQQSVAARKLNRRVELLANLTHLTTTHINRLIDQAQIPGQKKLPYADRDEGQVAVSHATKSNEMLLVEIDKCRIEYLALVLEPECL